MCRKLAVLGRYPTVPGLWADVDAENPGEEGDAAVQQNRAHRVFFTRIPIRLLSYVRFQLSPISLIYKLPHSFKRERDT